jgi:hypothetical protein
MQTSQKDVKPQKPLPPPNSDFYQLAETLSPDELATLRQVREKGGRHLDSEWSKEVDRQCSVV